MEARDCAVGQAVSWREGKHKYEGQVVKVEGQHRERTTARGGRYTEYEVAAVWVVALMDGGKEIPPTYEDDPTDRDEQWRQVDPTELSLVLAEDGGE